MGWGGCGVGALGVGVTAWGGCGVGVRGWGWGGCSVCSMWGCVVGGSVQPVQVEY